jgi:hypothetical protein
VEKEIQQTAGIEPYEKVSEIINLLKSCTFKG